MKGKQYLNFLEKWGIINDRPLDIAIEHFEPKTLEQFLKEWLVLHIESLKNDEFWSNNAGLPLIPTSGISRTNIDLIANIALYDDRQIIHDPIDIALKNTGTNPIQHLPRFVSFLKRELENIIELQPLIRVNLIELIPYQFIVSNFSKNLTEQLHRDWFESESLKYIEERMKWRVYIDSNILAFHIGDLDTLLFEKYGIINKDIMEETENGLMFQCVFPPNLENIDKDVINNLAYQQFHKHSSQIANNINENIILAELFSGSIATNEMLTHEFIKRKNAVTPQRIKDTNISTHHIPILGKINLEKFVDFRANELPSFVSFREEWNEGRGLFAGEISSKNWIENLNQELYKCKKELEKNKKRLHNNILESSGWAGVGICVGVLAGSLVEVATLTTMVPFVRDIKDKWMDYLKDRSSIKTSTPFFLLNVIDRKTNNIKTDIPPDLSEKMTISQETIKSSLSMWNGAPIIVPKYPQGKARENNGKDRQTSN